MKFRTLAASVFAVILFNVSCQKVDYIPDLGARWVNTASTVSDQFFFNDVGGGGFKSDFIGNESVAFAYEYNLKGSFKNHEIHFTFIDGPRAGVTFSGTIDGEGVNEKITLTSPSGNLVLTR